MIYRINDSNSYKSMDVYMNDLMLVNPEVSHLEKGLISDQISLKNGDNIVDLRILAECDAKVISYHDYNIYFYIEDGTDIYNIITFINQNTPVIISTDKNSIEINQEELDLSIKFENQYNDIDNAYRRINSLYYDGIKNKEILEYVSIGKIYDSEIDGKVQTIYYSLPIIAFNNKIFTSNADHRFIAIDTYNIDDNENRHLIKTEVYQIDDSTYQKILSDH